MSIARAELREGRLEAEVVVTNTAGHKVPTAYPSRRAWLRFVVSDDKGRRLFSSGALRPDGSIEGNDNDRDLLAFEPHHLSIEAPDQVQIYESIMVDPRGRVTTGLLTAVRYAKDNRLLPRGFDKAAAGDDYAVRGEAQDDPDFQGGGDRIVYRPTLPAGAAGPFRIEVELLYQPIAFRWAHNLERVRVRPRAGALRPLLRGDVHRLRDDAGPGRGARAGGAALIASGRTAREGASGDPSGRTRVPPWAAPRGTGSVAQPARPRAPAPRARHSPRMSAARTFRTRRAGTSDHLLGVRHVVS